MSTEEANISTVRVLDARRHKCQPSAARFRLLTYSSTYVLYGGVQNVFKTHNVETYALLSVSAPTRPSAENIAAAADVLMFLSEKLQLRSGSMEKGTELWATLEATHASWQFTHGGEGRLELPTTPVSQLGCVSGGGLAWNELILPCLACVQCFKAERSEWAVAITTIRATVLGQESLESSPSCRKPKRCKCGRVEYARIQDASTH
jgi:hypothetical protein